MNYFLYNGVELPALPEWDKTQYPYVAIAENLFGTVFFGTAEKIGVNENGVFYIPVGAGEVSAFKYSANPETGEWYSYTLSNIIENNTAYPGKVIWANYDVCNYADGTLYLSATAPISLANQTVIEWDGVTDGLESTTYNGLTYYRVADGAPSIKQLKGGYTVVSSTSDELGTVLTTGVNAEYDYFEDNGIYGADPWLVKDGAVWLQRYTDGADEVQYISLLSYATVVADIDPVAFMTGFQLGQAIRGLLK